MQYLTTGGGVVGRGEGGGVRSPGSTVGKNDVHHNAWGHHRIGMSKCTDYVSSMVVDVSDFHYWEK